VRQDDARHLVEAEHMRGEQGELVWKSAKQRFMAAS
jgi:hypothetical protein